MTGTRIRSSKESWVRLSKGSRRRAFGSSIKDE